jgi:hypothetical protein
MILQEVSTLLPRRIYIEYYIVNLREILSGEVLFCDL